MLRIGEVNHTAYGSPLIGFSPCFRGKQDQHRQDLEPSGEHVEDQDQLRGIGIKTEISHRVDMPEPRTDIVEGCCNCGKIGEEVLPVEGNQKDGKNKDKYIENQVAVHRANHAVLDAFTLQPDRPDRLRMDDQMQLLPHLLNEDQKPRNLKTAAGGARTGARKHQKKQHHLRRLRPESEVQRGKAGRRNQGAYREEGMMKGIEQSPSDLQKDTDTQKNRRQQYDQEIGARLLTAKRRSPVPLLQEVKDIEIHAE